MGERARTLRHLAWPTLGTGAGACIVVAAVATGLRPLTDNSFFTHLATGRVILETGSVPSADPYTFTAPGHDWLVQSWLASLSYAFVEQLTGAVGLRVLIGIVSGVLMVLAWRLASSARSLVSRFALASLFLAVSVEYWSARPLMLGLVALACTALAAEGDLDPRWLLPVGWVWVNTHGSFPLGLVYLMVLILGGWLDKSSVRRELGSLAWLAGGLMFGAAGPLGPEALVFPVALLKRQDVLSNVIEWRSPSFDSFSQLAFLVQLMVAVVLLVRRPSYRIGFIVAVFGGTALLGSRNLPVASLVLLPAMAAAAPKVGTLRSQTRGPVGAALGALSIAALVVMGAMQLDKPNFDLRTYPVDAVAYLDQSGVDLRAHRMATEDTVGNFLELIRGPRQEVFYDDRFDMFPREVSAAHLAMVRSGPSARSALTEYHIELVLWDRLSAFAQRLLIDPDWRTLYTDERWIVTCLRGSELGGQVGRC